MPGQIDLNKDGGERDYGPFSSSGKDDISPAMKAVIEAVENMELHQDDDSVDTKGEKPEQSQDSIPSDEQIKH